MDDPKQMLWNIFCALVRPSTLERHRQQGKCCFFYTILHIYLQVSETEGLAELHRVIGLSV